PLKEISSGIGAEDSEGALTFLDPLTGKGFREFSILIEAFNAMAGRIRSQVDKITRLEAMMRNILDSSPAIVVALNSMGRIWYLNAAGERFFKVSKRDVAGKSLRDLDPGLSKYKTRVEAVLTAREPEFLRSEKWLNDRMVDGTIYPLVANGIEGVVIQWLDVSEKYRLRESYRSRLEAIFSHMEDLICVANPNYTIEVINEKMARLVGSKKTEQPCYKIIRNRDTPCPECHFPEVRNGKVVKTLLQSPYGNNKTYDLIAAPLENEDGSFSMLSVLRDVTEDIATQEALRVSETAYRNLFEQAPVGMSLLQAGKFVMVNQALCDIVGYASKELIGASIFKIVHHDEFDFVSERIKNVSSEKTIAEPAREKYVRKDGAAVEVLVIGIPSEFRGKQAVQTVVIDLTEQSQLQASLLRSEAFSAEVLEKALDPIVVIDAETMAIVDANPPAEAFFSLSLDRLVGTRWEDFFREEDLAEIEQNRAKLIRNGAVRVTTREMALPSGRRVVDLSVIMVETADAQSRYIVFIKDLTEFMAVQERLSHVQKQESLWQMAGGFAHDFNNLLAIMFGYLDMIEVVSGGGSKQQIYVDKLKEVSERARDLVQNILMFSGTDEGERKPHGIREIVDTTVDLARPVIGQLVNFTVVIANPDDAIFVDKTRMVQILLNLLLNARDAIGLGKPGKITLECRGKQVAEEEGKAIGLAAGLYEEIVVSDTGAGIPLDIQDKIFDPFFTTKGKGTQKGTGLGLAIVHSIVSNYDGRIHFSSSEEGTRFSLLIPLRETVEVAEAAVEDVTDTVKGKERILIVEDEALLRDVSRDMLEMLGYQVDEACDGREAVDMVTATPDRWDVILMDLSMPRLGGEEALKIMRDLRRDLKIMILSGLADEETRRRVLEAGATAFVRKPINMSILSDVIRRVLSE
ncbi:MAG: PAS domain S-box protein, partial [Nitrospiraceae bacterium]|nr:PAS domain S-box protein [Nitrospiraceae bacterium]